jgi:hypothetical protein
MTKLGFGKQLALGAIIVAALAMPALRAQQDEPVPEENKVGTLIKAGDVLSGQLNALRVRAGNNGQRVATYQLTSEPHRLPAPSGLCGLETGPETFQIVPHNEAQAAQLKGYVGKSISLRVDQIACAEDAGEMSEAIVSKWSLVTRH